MANQDKAPKARKTTARKSTQPEPATAAPSTVDTLQQQVADLQAQLRAMAQLGFGQHQATATVIAAPSTLKVGVRNISSYTIGLESPQDGSVQLYAAHPEGDGVGTTAEISYTYWHQLRRGLQVTRGMIVRDDSILGPNVMRAPEDDEGTVSPSAVLNQVADPRAWIESRSEDEIKRDVERMTSEPSLRRLLAMVDQKIREIGEERYLGDPKRGEKAVRDLPLLYRLTETECNNRLDQLTPNFESRSTENKTVVRF